MRHKRQLASFPELGAFERNLPVAHLPRGGKMGRPRHTVTRHTVTRSENWF